MFDKRVNQRRTLRWNISAVRRNGLRLECLLASFFYLYSGMVLGHTELISGWLFFRFTPGIDIERGLLGDRWPCHPPIFNLIIIMTVETFIIISQRRWTKAALQIKEKIYEIRDFPLWHRYLTVVVSHWKYVIIIIIIINFFLVWVRLTAPAHIFPDN